MSEWIHFNSISEKMNKLTFYKGNSDMHWFHFKIVIKEEMNDENQAG